MIPHTFSIKTLYIGFPLESLLHSLSLKNLDIALYTEVWTYLDMFPEVPSTNKTSIDKRLFLELYSMWTRARYDPLTGTLFLFRIWPAQIYKEESPLIFETIIYLSSLFFVASHMRSSFKLKIQKHLNAFQPMLHLNASERSYWFALNTIQDAMTIRLTAYAS